jgi:hypothetical protein
LFSFSTLSFFKHTIIEREKTKKARAQRERERERGREMEDTESKFKRVCVFCGSSSGKKASYQEAAVELAKELVIVFIYVYTHTRTSYQLTNTMDFSWFFSHIHPYHSTFLSNSFSIDHSQLGTISSFLHLFFVFFFRPYLFLGLRNSTLLIEGEILKFSFNLLGEYIKIFQC